MRRTFGVFLILLYGLGPLAEMLPASSESRLPACCRRHGAHHCALSAAMASMSLQASSGRTPVVTAPSHCPNYPGSLAASPEPIQALTAPPASLPVLLAETHSPAASRAAARLSQIRTRAGRGPPSSLLG
jgi:hypothetical protein